MLTGSFCHKLGQWTLNWTGTCSQERGANSLSILCTAKVGVAEHCPEIRRLRGPHVLCLANVPGLSAFQGLCLCITGGFPGRLSGEESACQCGRLRRHEVGHWVRKIPWRSKQQPTPVLLPGKFHGQRSLVGYSPWGHKTVGYNWAREPRCQSRRQKRKDSQRQVRRKVGKGYQRQEGWTICTSCFSLLTFALKQQQGLKAVTPTLREVLL